MKLLFASVAALVLLTGCVTWGESYSILDLKTEKSLSLKKQSVYPEEIIGMDGQAKTFRIFTRTEKGGFEIRDLRYDGSMVRKFAAKQFSAYILRYYGLFREGFAVSADGSRVAYFDLPSGELRLFNVMSNSQDILLNNVTTNELSVALLEWRSDNELIVGVDASEGRKARLLMMNVEDKSLVFELHPCNMVRHDNTLSHNRRYLAYQESCGGTSPRGSFRIYDIQSQREVGLIPARRWIVGKPYWGAEDRDIVYADGSDLMEYSLARGESKCVKSYPEEMSVHLYGYERNNIFYALVPAGENTTGSPLYVYSVLEQKEQRINKAKINGRVLLSPGGDFVITGWGY